MVTGRKPQARPVQAWTRAGASSVRVPARKVNWTRPPTVRAVVVGCAEGYGRAVDLARGLGAACPETPVGLLLSEDVRHADVMPGLFCAVLGPGEVLSLLAAVVASAERLEVPV